LTPYTVRRWSNKRRAVNFPRMAQRIKIFG
jgi:hypothetical protein